MNETSYPEAVNADLVGTYSPVAGSGGGYVWDEVLEYRVWCHPQRGAPEEEGGNDYYHAYATYAEAAAASLRLHGAEKPIALIRQVEYIEEFESGDYRHVTEERVTEWPVDFLERPRRTPNTIPHFLSPSAPANRLDILRGLAKRQG